MPSGRKKRNTPISGKQSGALSTLERPTIYEQLGGETFIRVVVEHFYDRVLSDPLLQPFFAHVNMVTQKSRQVEFFSHVLGGPQRFRGPTMRDAHAHLRITERHFTRVAEHLLYTLKIQGVSQALIDQILTIIGPLATEIVNTPYNQNHAIPMKNSISPNGRLRAMQQSNTEGATAVLDVPTDKGVDTEDLQGIMNAISRAQAVIEFNPDGTVIKANENFLATLGYTLSEVQGQHHRMFCDPEYAASREYQAFWEKLNAGKFDAGQYRRIGKGGKEIWIQASYNPVFGEDGRLTKVVKFATDITKEMLEKLATERQIKEANDRERENATKLQEGVTQIAEIATNLAGASEQLTATSQQMSSTAEETANQANVVSAAAEEVSKNVQSVATGAEEMSATIKEVAKNTTESAKVASQAVKVAESTNTTVAKLGESSAEIGSIIKVITSIAQQTNLLALNATIEAARAGEAGKGFAVVANEVKELAKETTKATENISQMIETIQVDTKGAVEAIGQITTIIKQVNDFQTTIASAVEEQSATTNEMTRNVTEASKGSMEIASNITSVAQAAKGTTEGATDTQMASKELAKMAVELQQVVSTLT